MVYLEVEIDGDKQLSRVLLTTAAGLRNFNQPLQDIGEELQKSFQENFDSQGGLFGGWPERTKDYPWPILEKTGNLRGGFEQVASDTHVSVFNVVPYAVFHQKGTSRMPKRVIMKADRQRQQFIVKAIQSYIVDLMKG